MPETDTPFPYIFAVMMLVLALLGCGGEDANTANSDAGGASNGAASNRGGDGFTPVTLDASDFTYVLEEGWSALGLWTTPVTHRVRAGDAPPEDTTRSGLSLSAARGEYEPVQVILGAGVGRVEVSVAPFPELGDGQRLDLYTVGFVEGWSETLAPLDGGVVERAAEHGTPILRDVYVPPDAPAGVHRTTLILAPEGGASVEVPVELYVFDFSIAGAIHYATQMNISVGDLVPEGGDVDDAKALLFGLRFTPKSVTWPSGFNGSITWENPRSSSPCEVFWDEPDEPDAYAIGALAPRYMLGEGWNSIGFPNSMVFQFVNNATPRPETFCGVTRGDHYGSDAYNAEWSQFLSALDAYLVEHDLATRAYYYVQNEPQNDEDHRLAAHLCRLTRAAAPNLRIAISEEPKRDIAEDSGGGCGYDIWIAHVRAYQQDYAWERQALGEQVWLYSLDQDPEPFFNPTLVEGTGMHARIIPWVSWGLRARGFAFYDAGRWFHGKVPGVRAMLLREGFEDYEYLWHANGGAHPRVLETEPVDATVQGLATSLTSWSRDADALMTLRHALGLYIEGSQTTLPVLETDTDVRVRGAYYLNFQDPEGKPDMEPLVIDGQTYQKIGWSAFDEVLGYGWFGEFVGDSSVVMYGYDGVDGVDERLRSYVYDDWGRANLFEFVLANGRYAVTVGVGRPAKAYPGDPHNLTIEGVTVVDDEPTIEAQTTFVRTVEVELRDGMLSVEMGGRSQTTGDFAYTFLGFMEIEPID